MRRFVSNHNLQLNLNKSQTTQTQPQVLIDKKTEERLKYLCTRTKYFLKNSTRKKTTTLQQILKNVEVYDNPIDMQNIQRFDYIDHYWNKNKELKGDSDPGLSTLPWKFKRSAKHMVKRKILSMSEFDSLTFSRKSQIEAERKYDIYVYVYVYYLSRKNDPLSNTQIINGNYLSEKIKGINSSSLEKNCYNNAVNLASPFHIPSSQILKSPFPHWANIFRPMKKIKSPSKGIGNEFLHWDNFPPLPVTQNTRDKKKDKVRLRHLIPPQTKLDLIMSQP